MAKIKKLLHTRYRVNDLEKTVAFYRDVLGLQEVDTVNKNVSIRFTDTRLDWCEGRMPTLDGPVELRWRKENGKRIYQVVVPAGYTISTENRSALPAEQR